MYHEGNHWDDVISRYKEVDTGNYQRTEDVVNIFNKVLSIIQSNMNILHNESKIFMSPHLIDLAPDGYIGK
jgi:hypothetical protein